MFEGQTCTTHSGSHGLSELAGRAACSYKSWYRCSQSHLFLFVEFFHTATQAKWQVKHIAEQVKLRFSWNCSNSMFFCWSGHLLSRNEWPSSSRHGQMCLFKIWRQIRLKSQEERAEGINILVGTCLWHTSPCTKPCMGLQGSALCRSIPHDILAFSFSGPSRVFAFFKVLSQSSHPSRAISWEGHSLEVLWKLSQSFAHMRFACAWPKHSLWIKCWV